MPIDKLKGLKQNKLLHTESDLSFYTGKGFVPQVGTEVIPQTKSEKLGLNNFEYQVGKNYVHFFKERAHAESWSKSKITPGGNCIVVIDIPDEILNRYEGKGIYGEETKTEYAIPMDEFDPTWIQEIIEEKPSERSKDEFSQEI